MAIIWPNGGDAALLER